MPSNNLNFGTQKYCGNQKNQKQSLTGVNYHIENLGLNLAESLNSFDRKRSYSELKYQLYFFCRNLVKPSECLWISRFWRIFSQIRQSETSLAELIILTNLCHILDISPKKVHFEIFLPLGGVIPDRN